MTLGLWNRYHISYGIHSRIPTCCIRFFIYHWERMMDEGHEYYRFVRQYVHWNYVPCPKCLGSGHKVNIRLCRQECGRECHDDFLERARI